MSSGPMLPGTGGAHRGQNWAWAHPSAPLLALEFLTVVRLRRPPLASTGALAAAQAWYPAVGLLLGLGLAGLDRLLSGRLPPAPTAVVLLVALEGLTGFLHLDGLADCADGLLGLHTRTRRLEIMRDSRVGVFGASALMLYLLLMYALLSALSGPVRAATLVAFPASGRGAVVLMGACFAYARPDGLGLGFQAAARGWPGVVAGASMIVGVVFALGPSGLVPAAAGIAAACCVGGFARARLGGITGDVFGASCELGQAAFLCTAVALQSEHWFGSWL